MKKIKGINHLNKPIEVYFNKGKIVKINYLKSRQGIKNFLFPGFIEIHEHGGYGFDWFFANKNQNLLKKYLYKLAKNEGTTSIVATIMTASAKSQKTAIENIVKAIGKYKNGANVLGFHLEGPFINKQKKGAHPEKYLCPLTLDKFNKIVDSKQKKFLKIITIAPEITTKADILEIFKISNLKIQIGHSMASVDDYLKIKKYVSGITHFNNAMQKWNSSENSLAKEAMKNKELYLEFINDNIHNSKELAKNIYNFKAKDKIILVTDSLSAKGLKDGIYQGPNGQIIKKKSAIWTKNGILNGSTHTLMEAFKNWIIDCNATIEEAVLAVSTNPAKYLKLKKGELLPGYDADFIVMDFKLNLLKTYINGKKIK